MKFHSIAKKKSYEFSLSVSKKKCVTRGTVPCLSFIRENKTNVTAKLFCNRERTSNDSVAEDGMKASFWGFLRT